MQCLHSVRRFFVPLPWRFLAQPELQQGPDSLNCKPETFLMLYAIKIKRIYINEQVVSIFLCNLRSDSELEWRHFGDAIFFLSPTSSNRRHCKQPKSASQPSHYPPLAQTGDIANSPNQLVNLVTCVLYLYVPYFCNQCNLNAINYPLCGRLGEGQG